VVQIIGLGGKSRYLGPSTGTFSQTKLVCTGNLPKRKKPNNAKRTDRAGWNNKESGDTSGTRRPWIELSEKNYIFPAMPLGGFPFSTPNRNRYFLDTKASNISGNFKPDSRLEINNVILLLRL
jgi:hypothetical protein